MAQDTKKKKDDSHKPRANFMRGLNRIGGWLEHNITDPVIQHAEDTFTFGKNDPYTTGGKHSAIGGRYGDPITGLVHQAVDPFVSGDAGKPQPMTDQAFQAYMAQQGLAPQYKSATDVPIPKELDHATPEQKAQYQQAIFSKQTPANANQPDYSPPINPLAAQAFFSSFVAPLMKQIGGMGVQTGSNIPVPGEVRGAMQQHEQMINNYPLQSAINASLAQPFADQLTARINNVLNKQTQTYMEQLKAASGGGSNIGNLAASLGIKLPNTTNPNTSI